MRQLNPTLWRTCRVLAGPTRIKFLRQIHDHPGQNVSALAECVQIGVSAASQDLRRIQSRGLLQADRKGPLLIYRMGADPQVPSAAPLLKALRKTFESFSPEQDEQMISIATGLSHPRRIAIAKIVMTSPIRVTSLRLAMQMSPCPMHHHLKTLAAGGWTQLDNHHLIFRVPPHPLAQALAKQLQDS